MSKLVQLRSSQGETQYAVNPALVTFVQDTTEAGACVIHFVGGGHVTVTADYAELTALLTAG